MYTREYFFSLFHITFTTNSGRIFQSDLRFPVNLLSIWLKKNCLRTKQRTCQLWNKIRGWKRMIEPAKENNNWKIRLFLMLNYENLNWKYIRKNWTDNVNQRNCNAVSDAIEIFYLYKFCREKKSTLHEPCKRNKYAKNKKKKSFFFLAKIQCAHKSREEDYNYRNNKSI